MWLLSSVPATVCYVCIAAVKRMYAHRLGCAVPLLKVFLHRWMTQYSKANGWERTSPTLRTEHSCQALSQLRLCFVVGLHENPQKLRWKAIPQYTLSEQAHSTSVDPRTEGLHINTQSHPAYWYHATLMWSESEQSMPQVLLLLTSP